MSKLEIVITIRPCCSYFRRIELNLCSRSELKRLKPRRLTKVRHHDGNICIFLQIIIKRIWEIDSWLRIILEGKTHLLIFPSIYNVGLEGWRKLGMRLHNLWMTKGALENVERVLLLLVGFLSSILSSSLDICIGNWCDEFAKGTLKCT